MGTWRRLGGCNKVLRRLMCNGWVTTQVCHSERLLRLCSGQAQEAKNLVYVYEIDMVE